MKLFDGLIKVPAWLNALAFLYTLTFSEISRRKIFCWEGFEGISHRHSDIFLELLLTA